MGSFLQKPEDFAAILAVVAVFVLMLVGRLPSIQHLIDLANVLNSKGGNLLILTVISLWFFTIAMRFTYHIIDLDVNGKITADNAIALSGFAFVTGTAFGGAFGALLKGMSGEAVTSTSASKVESVTTQKETVTTPATAVPSAVVAPAEPPVVPEPPVAGGQ